MTTNPREILIYYNPASVSDRKMVAYAKTMSPHIKSYSYDKANCTSTMWQGIINRLEIEPKKLFNKALPEYQSKLKGMELDEEGWINVIKRNPHLLRAPIAMRGKHAVLCESPTDVLRLD